MQSEGGGSRHTRFKHCPIVPWCIFCRVLAQGAGKLCATPFGVDIVGITEFILLVGAFVGGAVARQRKQEMEKLNDQLRTINISLRQQARSGTVYAPGMCGEEIGTQGRQKSPRH